MVSRHFQDLCDLSVAEQDRRIRTLGLPAPLEKQLLGMLRSDSDPEMAVFIASAEQFRTELNRSSLVGQSLGPYCIEAPLGEGAMGDVYTARRADGQYDATVAIKFLASPSLRGKRLFDRERRILALLDHPAIARLIDAGEDPRFGAYLVMEYVDGCPVDRFVREQRLDAREIVKLVIDAADAVSAAHRSLILHRDLKPDHILIDADGRLRVLDFGVAQFMDTTDGQALRTEGASFTPRYAAPEQILGEATTTATDVFALGIILYELLSDGRSPFTTGDHGDHADIAARLADKPAIHASQLHRTRQLAGPDRNALTEILRKGLMRDPRHRYTSAEALAEDLRALLAGKPVTVRSTTTVQTLMRWARHHRLAAGFAMLALLTTIGGAGFSIWFAQQAHHERLAAVDQATRAGKTAEFLEYLFASASPGEAGPSVTARSLLMKGKERLETELADQPELVAHLEAVIGRSFLNLGLFEDALAITDNDSVPTSPERALLRAQALNRLDRYADAVAWLDRAFPTGATAAESVDEAIIRSTAFINLGELDASQQAAERALEIAGSDLALVHRKLTAQSMMAAVAFNRSDYAEALHAYEAILALHVERDGERDTATGLAHHNVGGVAFMHGNLDKAVYHYQQAISIYRDGYGEDNRAVSMSLRSLGLSLRRAGRAEEAQRVLAQAVAALAQWESTRSPVYRDALLQLAELHWLLGEPESVAALLSGLPDAGEVQSAHAVQVECRLRVMAALSGPLTRLPECIGDQEFPSSVQAFIHLAQLELAGRTGVPANVSTDEALAAVDALIPGDPLLRKAVETFVR